MKFCPECGTILMPREKGKYTWLVCPDCGHYQKLKDEADYKIGGERKRKEKSKVVIIEREKKRKFEQPDYDIDTDAFAELYEES